MNVPDLNDIDEVTRDWIVRLATKNGLDPDHLQAACEAAYGSPVQESDDLDEMARALKAFADRHEQMVRAKMAREVGETIDCDTLTDFDCGMAHAITIILGEVDPSPEELGLPPEIFSVRGES